MSTAPPERMAEEPSGERPSLELAKIREVRKRDLGYRFLAGALTSVAAGLLTLGFGSRVGGIMLASPATLAASLTLIARRDGIAAAREDARGGVIGGGALGLFAAVAALTLGEMNGALALLLATAAWFAGALLGYAIAWLR